MSEWGPGPFLEWESCYRCGVELPLDSPAVVLGDVMCPSAYGFVCRWCLVEMPGEELWALANMTRLAAEFAYAGVAYEFPDDPG